MNNFISKKEISDLANIHDQHCVSVYLPTSRTGDERQGPLKLKNSLKDIRQQLQEYGLSSRESEDYLEPVKNLLDDNEFWRRQSDCLVIFLKKEYFQYFTLPIRGDEITYVSDHFYLKPLISLFNGDGKFFLLSLSLQDVKLYRGTRNSITQLVVNDLVPEKLEEAVGYDFKDKSLQFRSGQGGDAGAIFHGQGAGKDDKNKEIEKFFNAVDKGVMKLLHDENAPLLLACVDHYYPIYASITNYAHLFKDQISGNPEHIHTAELQEKAWVFVGSYFQKERQQMIDKLRNTADSTKTSLDLNDVVPAAIDGRIEVLFVHNTYDRYGLYDKVNRTLIVEEDMKKGHSSLYNLAVVQTWLNGGSVFLADSTEMPFEGTKINALFRY